MSESEESSCDAFVSSTTGFGSVAFTHKKNVNRGRWTKEEDEKLKNLIESYGENDWNLISSFFADRNDLQCNQRWDKVVNPKLVKGPWTKQVRTQIALTSC